MTTMWSFWKPSPDKWEGSLLQKKNTMKIDVSFDNMARWQPLWTWANMSTQLKFSHSWNFHTYILAALEGLEKPENGDWTEVYLLQKKFQLVWSSQQIKYRIFSFIFFSINQMGWDNLRSPQVVMQRLTDGYLETTKHVGYQDSSVQGNSPSLKVLGTENFI